MKKTIVISCLSLSILGLSSITPNNASAAELTSSESESKEIKPYVNWSGSAYLTTSAYSNVTSSNNIFNDRPTVTNYAGNKGSIKVRVVDSSGKQIGGVKEIAKGKSVKLDSIPWNSGTYTLQAKAISSNGSYSISIN
ncbi:hypothetical protein IEQ_05146 [Bacillus cereus BAG6X1-2]|nr:hypothetical protein IEQ_05146 [Bacillus cereus BAG6X1-2]